MRESIEIHKIIRTEWRLDLWEVESRLLSTFIDEELISPEDLKKKMVSIHWDVDDEGKAFSVKVVKECKHEPYEE